MLFVPNNNLHIHVVIRVYGHFQDFRHVGLNLQRGGQDRRGFNLSRSKENVYKTPSITKFPMRMK